MKAHPNCVVVKRGLSGLGLFATEPIKRGTRIIEYTGEKISSEEADRRGGKYLFELNDRRTIDGSTRSNTARYINHSCKPNCYAEINAAETRVFIFAKRNIAAGEELSYNYGKEYVNQIIAPHGCRCQVCREKTSTSAH